MATYVTAHTISTQTTQCTEIVHDRGAFHATGLPEQRA